MNIRPEFKVHMLNERGKQEERELAKAFSELLDKVESIVPPCREQSIVKTKLEEALFFAKRGMAQLPQNQE